MKPLTFLRVLGLLALLLAGPVARAQAPGTGGPEPDPLADPTPVPLDGGAALLLAGGLGYGLRRLRRHTS